MNNGAVCGKAASYLVDGAAHGLGLDRGVPGQLARGLVELVMLRATEMLEIEVVRFAKF